MLGFIAMALRRAFGSRVPAYDKAFRRDYTRLIADAGDAGEVNTHALQLAQTKYLTWTDSSALIGGSEVKMQILIRPDRVMATGEFIAFTAKWGTSNDLLVRFREVSGGIDLQCIVTQNGVGSTQRSFVTYDVDFVTPETVYLLDIQWDGSQSGAAAQWTVTVNGDEPVGKTVTDDDGITTMNASTEPFTVGAMSNGSSYVQFFDGQVDEVKVYADIAMTTQILHWELDNDYTDASGNGRDATPVNDPTFVEPGLEVAA